MGRKKDAWAISMQLKYGDTKEEIKKSYSSDTSVSGNQHKLL
jgi:hypothetical protein